MKVQGKEGHPLELLMSTTPFSNEVEKEVIIEGEQIINFISAYKSINIDLFINV